MSTDTLEPVVDYDEALRRYDPVMGLEVHVELNTASTWVWSSSVSRR